MKKLIKKFGKIFEAVAFAEAGCRETALEMLDDTKNRNQKVSLNSFLENVGLNNVRVCYVTARI